MLTKSAAALQRDHTLSRPSLLRRVLRIAPKQASFAVCGFHCTDAAVQARLERVGRTFLEGYHAALEDARPIPLAVRLDDTPPEFRGFAFEGAAMGLALQDALIPGNRARFAAFLAGPGERHAYMLYVGVGWVWARLHRRVEVEMRKFDPLLRWLALDGYGFHEGYFHAGSTAHRQFRPPHMSTYASRAFDQGLGRSLWFANGADPARIANAIQTCPDRRHADLWSGVGLACAYAGGLDRAGVESLRDAAGRYQPELAQGAAFAATARERAGNPAECTETACLALCDMSAKEAARIPVAAMRDLLPDGELPAFEIWRRRIQARFGKEDPTS